jgi:hypothetical protein
MAPLRPSHIVLLIAAALGAVQAVASWLPLAELEL